MAAQEPANLYDLLRNLSTDMHNVSTRGCKTCRDLTSKLGWPFGCYEWQKQRTETLETVESGIS